MPSRSASFTLPSEIGRPVAQTADGMVIVDQHAPADPETGTASEVDVRGHARRNEQDLGVEVLTGGGRDRAQRFVPARALEAALTLRPFPDRRKLEA